MNVADEFADWYRAEYVGVVRALAAAVGDLETAREATDEGFARALERWPRVCGMESRTGWVYQVGLNVARRRARRTALERRVLSRPPASADDIEPLDADLWAAVRALPIRQRTAVALRYIADLPEPLIAEIMGVAVGTVSATLHAARKRLAADLALHMEPSHD